MGKISYLLLHVVDLGLNAGVTCNMVLGLLVNLIKSRFYGINDCSMWMPCTIAMDTPDFVSHPGVTIAVVASGG